MEGIAILLGLAILGIIVGYDPLAYDIPDEDYPVDEEGP